MYTLTPIVVEFNALINPGSERQGSEICRVLQSSKTSTLSLRKRETMTRVAIVTGGNKGIGYATCRALAKKFDGGDVFLTARSAERGNAAVEELAKEGCTVKFHQLDIDDVASIEKVV